MTWAGAFEAFVKLLGLLFPFLRERQARKDGGQAQVVVEQTETIHEVQAATEAREAVRADLAVHPDSVLAPDEFTRPD